MCRFSLSHPAQGGLLLVVSVSVLIVHKCCLGLNLKRGVTLALVAMVLGSACLTAFFELLYLISEMLVADERVQAMSQAIMVMGNLAPLFLYLCQLLVIYTWVVALRGSHGRTKVLFFVVALLMTAIYTAYIITNFFLPLNYGTVYVVFICLISGIQVLLSSFFLLYGVALVRGSSKASKKANTSKVVLLLGTMLFFNLLRTVVALYYAVTGQAINVFDLQIYTAYLFYAVPGTPTFHAFLFFLFVYILPLTIPNFVLLFVLFSRVFFVKARKRRASTVSHTESEMVSLSTTGSDSGFYQEDHPSDKYDL